MDWRDWLVAELPADLAARLVDAARVSDELLVFAQSAAWCSRLRYAMAPLEASIKARDPEVRAVRIRVRPGRPQRTDAT